MVAARTPAARVVAVTSGKGGVGKSNIAVNLAVATAALGKKVILIDLDLGLANADVLLNVQAKYNLSHVFAGRKDVVEALVPVHGIYLLAGASGLENLANLNAPERQRLRGSFERLNRKADLIFVDTGAGISRNVIEFASAADEVVVVTTPEPTALVDAYAVVKMLAREPDPAAIRLVVNQALNRAEADRVASGVASVADRFLEAKIDKLGYVLKDDAVGLAVRKKEPFVIGYPRSSAGACVRNLAARLALSRRAPAERRGFFDRLFGFIRKGA